MTNTTAIGFQTGTRGHTSESSAERSKQPQTGTRAECPHPEPRHDISLEEPAMTRKNIKTPATKTPARKPAVVAPTVDATLDDEIDEASQPPQYRERNSQLFIERRQLIVKLCRELKIKDGKTAAPSSVLRQARALGEDLPRAARLLMRKIERINEEIVTLNFGLVRDYVSRFTRASRTGLEDFESAGVVGLMQAIDTYDPAMGPFGQWAFRPIKRSVLRAVRDVEHSNMSPGDFEKRPELLKARNNLTVDGVEPSLADVAKQAGTTLDQARRVLAAPMMISTSLPTGERGESTLGETLADPETVEETVLTRAAVDALETYGLPVLNAREMFVMCRRFGIDGEPEAKLSAIGAALGLSREAVRNVEAKALAKLGHPAVVRMIIRSGRD
jgi:RNA polymerase sigma factor (sigma-70 family)